MQFTNTLFVLAAFLISSTASLPTKENELAGLLRAKRLAKDFPNAPTCGTTSDGVLSDCRSMLDAVGTSITQDYGRTCTVSIAQKVFNPFCSPGNCCFYTDRKDTPIDEVKKYGNMLLGCGSEEVNKVNGRVIDENGNQYCLSDGNGCNDCFED